MSRPWICIYKCADAQVFIVRDIGNTQQRFWHREILDYYSLMRILHIVRTVDHQYIQLEVCSKECDARLITSRSSTKKKQLPETCDKNENDETMQTVTLQPCIATPVDRRKTVKHAYRTISWRANVDRQMSNQASYRGW